MLLVQEVVVLELLEVVLIQMHILVVMVVLV